jgi:predicted RNase H-like HicB family nuclease
MKFTIEIEREADGRWIADVRELPGALAYGKTRAQARSAVEVLARQVIADLDEHREPLPR